VVVVENGPRMSLINKMLQDLDQRQALGTGPEAAIVRPAAVKPRSRDWFWRILAVLMLLSVAWVLWVSFQIMPRPIVTENALRAADDARKRPAPAPQPPAPIERAPAPVPVSETLPAQAAAEAPPPARDSLKLALDLQTPVRESSPVAGPTKAKPASNAVEKPTPSPVEKPAPSVDKRERNRGSELAEAHFRQAAQLLNQARVSEAQSQLVLALRAYPAHGPARQAYVSLLLEQQRIELARQQLQEALAITPGHPAFTLALARIYIESRDYAGALAVMDKAGAANKNADFQLLRGVILQRQARYAEAVDAYESAIRAAPQPGATWLGLAISLEGLGRRADAAEAYRRALVAGQLNADAREYAEAKTRTLE